VKNSNLVRALALAGGLLLQLITLCFQSRGAAGDVDLSFDPGSGVNGTVHALAVQSDGKVIIGGEFGTVKGLVRLNVARLNADGSGDPSFDPGTNAHGTLQALAVQADGKVIIVGNFYDTLGNSTFQAARLNNDGTLDDGDHRW
jgi:uncharacterized delta-60 repeat protein